MNRLGAALLLIVSLTATAAAQHPSQASSPAAPTASRREQAPPDFSHEPFVIEQYTTSVRYENDGTGEQDLSARIRVETDRGAQQLSELVFPYNSAKEEMKVRYARVGKPDGTTVALGAEAVKQSIAPAARDAPAYSNDKETHIAIPALAPGSVLEYEIQTHIVKPSARGEFWFEHSFLGGTIVLDERLAINVPASRKISLQSSAAFPYKIEHAGDRTIYRWERSNLAHRPDPSSNTLSSQQKAKAPDVQLTTFANWRDVARWYANLEHTRAEPSPEIRAKTEELTRASTSDLAKMQALYDYVSAKIRYVDIALGQDGYLSNSAAEIFRNGYGDSQDKHTLLAAMLEAAGFPAEAVLIPYTRRLDLSVASPSQFDHVITAVPTKTAVIWMDTSTEVAPFRLLASALRNKSAIAASADQENVIVKTPADPPFPSAQQVSVDGQVSDLGKLTATAHYSVRGDTELALRLAFHKTAEQGWRDLGQAILSLDGIHGYVTSVKPSDPFATHQPFELDIAFYQSDFMDWMASRQETSLPLLAIGLPDAPEDQTRPVVLGSPLNVKIVLRLALPPAYSVELPVGVSVARDYAEFSSAYSFSDHAITAERSVRFKMAELSAARHADYSTFARAVAADQKQRVVLKTAAESAPLVPASASADDLFDVGSALLSAGHPLSAIPLLERATQLDPRHKFGWDTLGGAYGAAGKLDRAVAAYRQQLEVDPSDEYANQRLGIAFEQEGNYTDAAAAFAKHLQGHPLDAVTHAMLGLMLSELQHDYARAVPELEKAAVLSPDNAQFQVYLGVAYAKSGKSDDATAAFEKAVSLVPTPSFWSQVAYHLADNQLELDKAQHYAELAVSSTENILENVDARHMTPEQLGAIENLGDYWDSLGWVYFKKGEVEKARSYLQSAWLLNERAGSADRLAQIYEKLGEKDRAIHACALALAVRSDPDVRARLTLLLGGNAPIENLVAEAKPELDSLRTIPAGQLLREDAQADFFILLARGGRAARVQAVRFISGDDALRRFADQLGALDYGAVFPDSSPAKIIRRGTLSCSAKTGDCTLTLILPGSARSN